MNGMLRSSDAILSLWPSGYLAGRAGTIMSIRRLWFGREGSVEHWRRWLGRQANCADEATSDDKIAALKSCPPGRKYPRQWWGRLVCVSINCSPLIGSGTHTGSARLDGKLNALHGARSTEYPVHSTEYLTRISSLVRSQEPPFLEGFGKREVAWARKTLAAFWLELSTRTAPPLIPLNPTASRHSRCVWAPSWLVRRKHCGAAAGGIIQLACLSLLRS